MPNLRNGSKGGFEPGLFRLRVRHSTLSYCAPRDDNDDDDDEDGDDDNDDDGNVDGDGTLGDVDRDQQRQRYSYDDIHDADDCDSDDAYYNSKNNVTNDWQTNKYNKDRLMYSLFLVIKLYMYLEPVLIVFSLLNVCISY